ncbi:hypothetical protein [Nocardiopsis ganjiahuensis]|uniref:hypothetical protein n=1 Tax=Nocardiopsis ganjiahuensis TaxID=239984 RepID=UPI000344AD3A|nr:hypothetical protein [Nocardiopsis ganjiahuensis]
MSATDPAPVLDLALGCLPALVGLVGLCLVGRLPRPRGAAVTGLVLLLAAPLTDVLLHTVLGRFLVAAGPADAVFALSHLSVLLLAAGLLFLAVAATRGTRVPEDRHAPGDRPSSRGEVRSGPFEEHRAPGWQRDDTPGLHRPYGGV